MTFRRRQHDLGAPDKLARSVAVADQNLTFGTVGGAKVTFPSAMVHEFVLVLNTRRPKS